MKRESRLSEKLARIYLAEVLLAIEDLHNRNILFRDLKPENILLDKNGHAILTDFGLSKQDIDEDTLTRTFCGSQAYLAPEIIDRTGHNIFLDFYLYGVMTYEMLTGRPPYYSKDRTLFFENIRHADLTFPHYLSENAKDFIRKLVNRDPSKRLGAGPTGIDEIKNHPWFKDIDWKVVVKKGLKPPKPIEKVVDVNIIDEDLFTEGNTHYEKLYGWSFASNGEEDIDDDDKKVLDNIEASN